MFNLVRSSESACYISTIALQVSISLLNLVRVGTRAATVEAVQNYLYATYLTEQDRDYV